ncbi:MULTISPECIES: CtsR family transcriptional regulator [Salimicrobium]|uniref:Transcriptional regulator CtsR n=2 Tax=Salimicrobium TaxID=351195 RepID=K2G536_9BACI|nr:MULTISPECIES: CtsR family transcriptional regulator [Salimicrobium]AKG05625.1 CtsR family transcriptional regulator [Salimicrobium jeotgali]EKE30378.1 transcriptional repressor CtsR [Salimicrobium jeotgali]MBM7696522.1 transcriptional regulator CtsR [Salimicrobium jeotgali]SDY23957.1 transcriptional regulator CtsR [Salimicrobium album]
MRNISDVIEEYLKHIIQDNPHQVIEIKRSDLAEKFQCVPSQINYVIKTRFTVEKGYIVESKRGGGGYIRIRRIQHLDEADLIDEVLLLIQPQVSQSRALDIVERLLENKVITTRESELILSVIDRNTLAFPLPFRDEIRSRVMTAMLSKLKYK